MQNINTVTKRPSPKRGATVGRIEVASERPNEVLVEQDNVTGNLTVTIHDDGGKRELYFETTDQLYQGVTTRQPRRHVDDVVQDVLLELGFSVVDPDEGEHE